MLRLYSSPSRLSKPLATVAYASTSATSSTTASQSPETARRRRTHRDDLPTAGVDLVAPPDPISNIRPVIYASKPTTRPSLNSPYSAAEFPSSYNESKLENIELEWRLRRERVDLTNHRFWAATNAEFNGQLAHRLSLLPPASYPPTPEDVKRKEDCTSQFYADWQIANQERQVVWVKEWWREIWQGLRIQTRIYVMKAMRRS